MEGSDILELISVTKRAFFTVVDEFSSVTERGANGFGSNKL